MSFKFLKILLFFPFFCGAQSFFELDTKAKYLYDEGKFIEASKELKKIKYEDKYKPYKGEIDFLIGVCYFKNPNQRNLNKSNSIFKRIRSSKRYESASFYNQNTLLYAKTLHRLGDFSLAFENYIVYREMTNDTSINLYINSCQFAIESKKLSDFKLVKSKLSSKENDFDLSLVTDEFLVISSTKNDMKEKTDSDIFFYEFDDKSNRWISRDDLLHKKINSYSHIQSPAFNSDKSLLYFSQASINKKTNTTGDFKLFCLRKDNEYWGKPILVPLPYEPNVNFKCPHLSVDEETLLFSSNMSGGFGGYDIWMIKRITHDKWTEPINLGNVINTSEDELYPFISESNKKLFFSSNGHLGIGAFDIFHTNIDDNLNTRDVVNLGYPFNSSNDDLSFVSINGNKGYLSSNRKGSSNFDIYFFNNQE
tara:strand:- start:3978 stop:5243 length:1266 start_codon:yes stop_codon:yes gene_type:complete